MNEWQQRVIELCWSCCTNRNEADKKMYGRELDALKKERPKEYEEAFQHWLRTYYDIIV